MPNLPVTTYSPDSLFRDKRRLFTELKDELLGSRELAFALFKRNIKAQFRQSALGYTWLLFPPIATTLVWFFLNRSGVVRVAETGIPYPAFVMIGTLLWQAFLDGMLKPIQALETSKSMLTKINFHRSAPVIAGIMETSVISAVRLTLLIPVFAFVGLIPGWTAVFFPVAYLAIVLLGTSFGTLLAPIGLLYTDIGRGLQVLGQFLMYAAPVVYPIATAGILAIVHKLNPTTYLLETGRELLTGSPLLYLSESVLITLTAFVLLLIAWTVLHISMPRLIERMGM
ncbi:MAG: ABC transporter permease [Verrucomicrobiota bacterium]